MRRTGETRFAGRGQLVPARPVLRGVIACVLILGQGSPVPAAPAQPYAACDLVGDVIEVSRRIETRDPAWALSWGLPVTQQYVDVELRPFAVRHEDGAEDLPRSCSGDIQVFQLPAGEPVPRAGDCIRARARLAGDEFSIGVWLRDVRIIACADARSLQP